MALTAQQLPMPGVPTSPEFVFHVYHDESGNYVPDGRDRWLLHGVLFVPEEKQDQVFQSLQKVRRDVGYDGEVHYGDLRGHPTGPKARCLEDLSGLVHPAPGGPQYAVHAYPYSAPRLNYTPRSWNVDISALPL